jgi:hypothetical protein
MLPAQGSRQLQYLSIPYDSGRTSSLSIGIGNCHYTSRLSSSPFLGLCIVPSTLWASAITPISVIAFEQQIILLPSYSNTTLLNQSWTDRSNLPSVRNSKAFFTYNVGKEFLGDLLAFAASAATVDGSVRQHTKSDFSRYTYSGQSYGIEASVGLTDPMLFLIRSSRNTRSKR